MSLETHVLRGGAIVDALTNEAGNAGVVRSAAENVVDHQSGVGNASVSPHEWEVVRASRSVT